ncbi:MAG TPA: universal stress protein [Solirubrobacteraceae bacterium]
MPAKILVSYDGTDNDVDALALGRVFAHAGGELGLAYVRHHRESEEQREEIAETDAETLLADGAKWVGLPDAPRHVVISGSTHEGLIALAKEHGYNIIVFGSAYRTTPGHVQPGVSAERLLESRPTVAVGVAPAGLRVKAEVVISIAAYVDGEGDPSAQETAASLAEKLESKILERATQAPDLLVVGSRTGAPVGTVDLSGAARYLIETVRCPVLIVGRNSPIIF